MTFNFNPNVPATNNSPAADQPIMQVNNQSISDIIAVDHVGFNNLFGGQHRKVTLSAPLNTDPTSSTGNISFLYSKIAGLLPQLFFEQFNSSGVGQTPLQLTGITNAIVSNTTVSNGTGTNYGVRTPWGFILNFGTVVPSSSPVRVTFGISNSSIYIALATLNTNNPSLNATVNDVNNSSMEIYSNTSGAAIFYLVLGQ